jgi:hypothetical protein
MSIGGLLDDIADSWKAIIAANPKKQVQKTLGAGFQQGMGFTELATRDVRKLMQIDQQKNRNRKQTGQASRAQPFSLISRPLSTVVHNCHP